MTADDDCMDHAEQTVAEALRALGCVAAVDPVDPEDCASVAVEAVRALRAGGYMTVSVDTSLLCEVRTFLAQHLDCHPHEWPQELLNRLPDPDRKTR